MAMTLKEAKKRKPNARKSGVVRMGIIGYGYWGPNLVRNLQDVESAEVVAVSDLNSARLKTLSRKFPSIRLTSECKDIFRDSSIDAVVIATPVSTHFMLAKQALLSGKHVFVEKPLAASVQECRALIEIARTQKKTLMVGHTFEYNPAVLKISEILRSGELGRLHYIDSVRVNLGRYQSDGRNVIWDLAPHDISIILHWIGHMPLGVSAWGQSFVQKGIEDVAFIRLGFPGGILAHIHVSWLAPAKLRRMTVVASQKMALYDDLENFEKIKIADRSAQLNVNSDQLRVDYRLGDIVSPHVDFKEPLGQECEHFIESIRSGKKPLTDGESGARVVRILEASDQSIKQGGKFIRLT